MKGEAKPKHILDSASGRLVVAGREEVNATQPLVEILTAEAGWSMEQIVTRPQWRVPASPSDKRRWPVDIAIFNDPETRRDPAHVRILCECKHPECETGIEQLKIYLDREPHARIGIWFNGTDHAILYKTASGYEEAPAGTPIPAPSDPVIPTGKIPLTLAVLRQAPSLVPIFKRIRDRIASQDRNVNRDEEILPDVSLLLLLKILDEQAHQFRPKEPLAFQVDETPNKTASRIRGILQSEVARNPQLFGVNSDEIRFRIDDDSIHYVIGLMQSFRLLSNPADAVAAAFQVIRGKAYKGEEGQYFTPQSVVQVAIAAVDPRPSDRVIDPACGSGSFLAAALSRIVAQLEKAEGTSPSDRVLAKREWSTQMLYAIDKDAVSVRLSKAFLSMLGDGSAHVFKADSIRPGTWLGVLAASVKDGGFDVVVTNPPFGTKLKVDASIGREERYDLSRKWENRDGRWIPTEEYEERDLGLLFLERSIRLLAEGGRIAIVLPDTYLFSDAYGWLVQWLSQFTITHSINVPIEAFEPHCRAKTSVVVLRKEPPGCDHKIIGSVCETFGEDKHGRPRFRYVGEEQTGERDDEMAETANLLLSPRRRSSKLFFQFPQSEAVRRGVLVARYWWREPYLDAVARFAEENDCDLVCVGDLVDSGELQIMDGHGSPDSRTHGRGRIPYIKVVDIKNWRLNENPKYFVPEATARHLRGQKKLLPFDLLTPTRASKNIGLFGVVLPWQTNVVLTREIAIWRVPKAATRLSPWLLLAMMSLRVVHDQFLPLVLMQMNREDLGKRYRELLLPIPRMAEKREQWSAPIRAYHEALVNARTSYEALERELERDLFVDRP